MRPLIADGDVPVSAWREEAIVRETLWMRAPERFEVVLGAVNRLEAEGRRTSRLVESSSSQERNLVARRGLGLPAS